MSRLSRWTYSVGYPDRVVHHDAPGHHGDGQADHGHWRKGFPYEFSAHIPMLLRWPETFAESLGIAVPRGAVIDEVSPHAPLRLMISQAVEC